MKDNTSEAWVQHLLRGRDPASAWPPPAHPGADYELATLVEVIPETPDTVTLRLARSRDEPFLAGQHFHVRIPTGGTWPTVETYSAASSPWPNPQIIDLTIKEIPGGRVSPVLVRRVPVGATLAIEGPRGYFTWNETDGGPLALVAAGSGIVPLMSIIRYATAKLLGVPTRLLYSSRDQAHTIYHQELAHLADQYAWLEVIYTFTADPGNPAARYHRRIDHDMVAENFADIAERCLAYVCGPFTMVVNTERALGEIGVAPGRMMSENWD